MKKWTEIFLTMAIGSMILSCAEKEPVKSGFSLDIVIPSDSKAVLGSDGFSMQWTEGDVIALNGQNSNPLEAKYAGKASATFTFAKDPGSPYRVVVPSVAYASFSSIFIPSRQEWVEGNISPNSIVLAGSSQTSQVEIHHLCSYIKLQLRTGSHTQHAISYISFYGNDSEAVAGTFDLEFDSNNVPHLLNPSAPQQKIVVTGCPQSGDFILSVPAMSFEKGFTIDVVDASGHFLRKRITSPVALAPGCIYSTLGEIVFNPTGTYIDGGFSVEGDIIGYVTDTNGRPLEGVVVSNGITSVSTDAHGAYMLPSSGNFVSLSIPSGYEIPYDSAGFPAFYKKVTNTSLPCNFVLTPLSGGVQREWTLCAMADPQVHSEDISRFAANIAPDMKQTLGGMSNVYSIILGDVLWNSASSVWSTMKTQLAYAKTGAHFFTVPGNHDLYSSQSATGPDHSMYQSHFGPENYSFNRGDVHVVCLNNIITKDLAQTAYKTGLTDEVFAWLKSDLALADKSKAVCLCMHANVTCNSNVENPHYSETLSLLSQFADAYILTGHLHRAEKFSHSSMGGAIPEYNLAAAFGNFWYTRTNLDGTPGGYNLFTFNRTKLTGNLLKGAGHDSSYQIRCYDGSESFTGVFTNPYSWGYSKGTVVANVFNWNPDWKVELWQNGVKVCDMTRITSSETRSVQRRTSEKDSFKTESLGQNSDWWQWCQVGEPYDGRDVNHPKRYKTDGNVFEGKVQGNNLGKSAHLFKGKLPVATGSFEVRATDPFGNTYSCSSFTSYTDGADAWNWK